MEQLRDLTEIIEKALRCANQAELEREILWLRADAWLDAINDARIPYEFWERCRKSAMLKVRGRAIMVSDILDAWQKDYSEEYYIKVANEKAKARAKAEALTPRKTYTPNEWFEMEKQKLQEIENADSPK
jgi:hypothetical protein